MLGIDSIGFNMVISSSYRQQNIDLHSRYPSYGTSGKRWPETVSNLAAMLGSESILDYGCGKGMLAAALPALAIHEYDPAIAGKDEAPEAADLVICTDVLEHIEPDMLDAVLFDLARVTKKVALFNIATRPAKKVLSDGRNAHLIIESPQWWQVRIEHYFTVVRWNIVPHTEVNAIVAPTTQAAVIHSRLSEHGAKTLFA